MFLIRMVVTSFIHMKNLSSYLLMIYTLMTTVYMSHVIEIKRILLNGRLPKDMVPRFLRT